MSSPDQETADPSSFTIGETVTWTHYTHRGSSISFTTRTGKIEQIGHSAAVVKMKNGRKDRVFLKDLRKEGQRTALTDMLFKDES